MEGEVTLFFARNLESQTKKASKVWQSTPTWQMTHKKWASYNEIDPTMTSSKSAHKWQWSKTLITLYVLTLRRTFPIPSLWTTNIIEREEKKKLQ